MTSRRPKRRRRERGSTLPRPTGGPAVAPSTSEAAATGGISKRERHTKTDYSYVRTDLMGVAAVAAVTLAFVIAMAFVV